MPSAPSDSSRNWWSLSKSSAPQEKASRISLNSIASAIGLKSKKQHPSIQDTLLTSPSTPTLSTRSRLDSTGPSTPVDYECQSLLSLSDSDPFAGRPILIPPVPRIPSEKTPISLITSITSSTNHASVLSPSADSCKLTNRPSMNNLQNFRSGGSTDPLRHTSLSPCLTSKRPGSSSTIVAGGQHVPKPKLRARGMTDGGGIQTARFFSDKRPATTDLSPKSSTSTLSPVISSTEHTSSRVVIRQASLSRLFAPPCAPPPTHSLPVTPHSSTKASSPVRRSDRSVRNGSTSPSRMSFVSSSSNEVFPALCYPLREEKFSERSAFSQDHDPEISSNPTKESKTAPSSPRTLKKTLSHQSLVGKANIHSPTLPKLLPDNMMDKVFRKQRSFHHTRSPMPPIPDPVGQPSPATSMTFSLTDFGPKAVAERRTSGNCLSGRKRLFSHSSSIRPSISHPSATTTEDDSQSVFSLRSDRSSHLVPFKAPQMAPQLSFLDEAASPVPSSPTQSASEYMPQPILSAAEVAKLEASIEDSSDRSARNRGFSFLSSELDFTPSGLSPPPTPRPRSKQGSMTGKSSVVRTPAFYSPLSSRARSSSRSLPTPNNVNSENDSKSMITYEPFSSESSTLTTSLPPPPRLRQRLISHPEHLSTTSLPSDAKPSRSKSIVDKPLYRGSITRKPSFLEIDDDTDQDIDLFPGEAMTESFLDLARESFETNRSDDS